MTWLTWRQFRTQTLVTLAALAAIAVTLGVTGPHLAHLFHTEIAGCLGQSSPNACSTDTLNAFTATDSFLQTFFGYALIVIPGLIGAFWGAPLLTRELEAGTHRLAWNQSVTRTRWLAVKVGLIGATSALTAGLFTLMLTWWSGPLDRVNANRITPPTFDQRGIDPIGWALFAFALGVTAGVLIHRTIPAMATTIAVFTAARILWPLYVRPSYLIPPVHKTARIGTLPFDWVGVNHGPSSPMVVHVLMPGAWILSDHTVNAAGHEVLGSTLFPLCTPTTSGGVTKHVPDSCFIRHLTQLGYNKSVLTYQPANRYWPLQWVETGVLAAVAMLLAAFCYWWVRRGKVS
jgi:hypothetical protein